MPRTPTLRARENAAKREANTMLRRARAAISNEQYRLAELALSDTIVAVREARRIAGERGE